MNYLDTYRGVVHINSGECGGECTLCGYAFDEPLSEHGGECMTSTDSPVTCPDCIERAEQLLPMLRRELKRAKKEGGAE